MLKGAVSLVTGGASGLGKATVERLVQDGGKVVLFDIQGARAKDVANKLNNVIAVPGCITSEEDVKKCLDIARDKFGRLNYVVNCAGISIAHPTYNFNKDLPHVLEDFANVVNVNIVGTFNVIRLSAGLLGENKPDAEGERGAILITSGTAAFDGSTGQSAIAAASSALTSMTLPLARDLSSQGIRVVTLAPGLFSTPLLAYLPQRVRSFLARASLTPSREGKPQEFAALAAAALRAHSLGACALRLDAGLRLALPL